MEDKDDFDKRREKRPKKKITYGRKWSKSWEDGVIAQADSADPSSQYYSILDKEYSHE